MKKLFAILSITLALYTKAQTIESYDKFLITQKPDSAKMLLNDFVKYTNHSFKYYGTAPATGDNVTDLIIGYLVDIKDSAANTGEQSRQFNYLNRIGKLNRDSYKPKVALLFYFDKYGEQNTYYVFNHVYGKFADILPIWIKYFNAKANETTIIANESDDPVFYKRANGKYVSYLLNKEGSFGWCIKMTIGDKPNTN
jgi:hypothetical protein